MTIDEFRRVIISHFESEGRMFPWRETEDPWAIMVSEFMLQQTQTERVIPYWKRWLRKWPSPKALASASLEEVLREWSGLGYNRRARFLREAAVRIVSDYDGKIPRSPDELLTLPGIGPYTSRAIACFAYNHPSVFIETNIRSVLIHFFFHDRNDVRDDELVPILEECIVREYSESGSPRMWYWALMDYGAALKKISPNPNRRSAHYTRQSSFEGSFRQIRGAVVRTLSRIGSGTFDTLQKETGFETEGLYKAVAALKKESMVAEENGIYRIP
ncbi:A/G-specific adenine glycosylase [Treponema sp. OttesenSCG-928-L16]|nr:A/G-specific adenine glycosylase [Treponema sp. OttesenSCG-928-L16]